MKRPAAAPRKRPAASNPPVTSAAMAEDPLPIPSPPSDIIRGYSNPYRYPTGSWGIRRAFSNKDNKQIFQFKKSGWTDEQNRDICEQAVSKLRAGESELAVLAWVNGHKKS
jgi:hypothetical protein